MEGEGRRLVLRWLDSSNPAIPRAVALAVLDTERCAPLRGGAGLANC